MKAEGRDSKSGTSTNAAESRDKAGTTNAQEPRRAHTVQELQDTKGADQTPRPVADHDRQRGDLGHRGAAGREADPDHVRDQVGEDRGFGRHQRELHRSRSAPASRATVHFHPLPPRIVEIYPEWRGYEFILVHGRYVIVRPQTHEIVYIIEG